MVSPSEPDSREGVAAGVLCYTAFDVDRRGGNPAGVVLDASELSDQQMQTLAADVGYSETAFVFPDRDAADRDGPRSFKIRYFSPRTEVAFCGHATIATAVAIAERDGTGDLLFRTPAGDVPVRTYLDGDRVLATLTSVEPSVRPVDESVLGEALSALRWPPGDLDHALPPRVANAGIDHLVVACATRERLAALDYDEAALGRLMAREGWTTLHLVWRETDLVFHARDPFPPGGVYEDPATGAAAAAFGAYLRDIGAVSPPTRITIHQGEDMGRPCRLLVDIGTKGGIQVSGSATVIGG